MPTTIQCPACHASATIANDFLGRKVKCRSCQKVFLAPDPAAAEMIDATEEPTKPITKRARQVDTNDADEVRPAKGKPPTPAIAKVSPLVYVLMAFVGLGLLGGGAGLAYMAVTSENKPTSPTAGNIPPPPTTNLGKNKLGPDMSVGGPGEIFVANNAAGYQATFPRSPRRGEANQPLPGGKSGTFKYDTLDFPPETLTVGSIEVGRIVGAGPYLQEVAEKFMPEPTSDKDVSLIKSTTFASRPCLEADTVTNGVAQSFRFVYANNKIYVVIVKGARINNMTGAAARFFGSLQIN